MAAPGLMVAPMVETAVAPAVADNTSNPDSVTDPVVCNVAPVNSATKRKPDPELRERCKALYLRGLRPTSIAAETGVSTAVIHVWINRHGWKVLRNATELTLDKRQGRVLSIMPAAPSAASNRTRDALAKVIEKHTEALAQVNAKADVKAIRKVGKALEPLVRSAKIVHGWGNDSIAGVVVSELLGHEQERGSSIAIAADVEQVPCGPDTPTGSVPDPIPEADTPQLTQATG